MKGAMNKILGAAAMVAFVAACSSSDDKDVAGGASGDMGIVASAITGDAQKGPFVKGSAVTVQGIDCKTLQLTDERFEGEVNSDKGDFSVKDVSLKSTCALFEVAGLYRSEITGKTSSKELTLRALTDLKDRENVNINILTNLEYERLVHLVTEKGKTFAEAKAQAEQEVLAAFNIAGSFEEFENLNIFESGDGNAALLAVSVMMQAKTDDAGLAKRIEKFEDSFAETGVWKDSAAKATIEAWQVAATADGTLDSIRKNVEGWGYADVVPAFEKYVEAFGDTVILSSDSKSSSSNEIATNSSSSRNDNSGSEYDATANTLKDLRDGKVYRTVKIGNQVWMAENLNFETDSSFCYNDSAEYCAKYGRLYTWTAATSACPDGWNLPSEADFAALVKAVGGEDGAATKLKSTSGWSDKDGKSGNGTDAFGFSALPAGIGNPDYYGNGLDTYFWGSTECGSEGVPETGDGCASTMSMDYDDVNVSLKSYAAKDLWFSVRCVMEDGGSVPESSSSSENVILSGDSHEGSSSSSVTLATPCKTETEDNCEYGTLTDSRDGQTYKTVEIGEQIWMAENLNYKTENSYCYRDADSNCTKFGRLYTWAAAMDSAAKWSINGYRCGSGTYCFPPYPVRGVCPEGWHLPRKEEWKTLIDVAGGNEEAGKALTSKNGWFEDGTDAFGFSALPSGYRLEDDYHGEPYYSFQTTYNASFWSSTDNSGDAASYMSLNSRNASVESYYRNSAYSVRCLKDDPPHELPSTVVTGTMTDERDGQTYKTVKIGKQIWMAENLNYAYTGVPYTFSDRIWDSTSWCYGNDPVYCAKSKYGRLYTWSAAMDSVGEWSANGKGCGYSNDCSPTYPVRGICPEGWHLPIKAEFETLFAAVGDSSTAGKMLKSTIGWEDDCNGTDDFGFSALPAGDRSNSGLFSKINARFWSSTEGDSSYAYGMNLDYDREYAILDDDPKEYGYSVRCVKD